MILIYLMAVGLAVGWLAYAFFINKKHLNLPATIVVAMIGSTLGGYAVRLSNISFHGLLAPIIGSVAGAAILIVIVLRIKN
jgi:uncharacterized membrane protein YeaQ/YmgE (transglycosylase-associated protein family)